MHPFSLWCFIRYKIWSEFLISEKSGFSIIYNSNVTNNVSSLRKIIFKKWNREKEGEEEEKRRETERMANTVGYFVLKYRASEDQ